MDSAKDYLIERAELLHKYINKFNKSGEIVFYDEYDEPHTVIKADEEALIQLIMEAEFLHKEIEYTLEAFMQLRLSPAIDNGNVIQVLKKGDKSNPISKITKLKKLWNNLIYVANEYLKNKRELQMFGFTSVLQYTIK